MIFRLFEIGLPRPVSDLNALRGALGKALYGTPNYRKIFVPKAESRGPSGLRDLPRPFVLRPQVINVFSNIDQAQIIAWALKLPHAIIRARQLDLEPNDRASRVRITFCSPTLLKGAEASDSPANFATLFARARDRVATLAFFYGTEPLPLNFRLLGDITSAVRTTRSDLTHHEISRHSFATGQDHPIGGFTGTAEYEGDLRPFLPILRAAEYTGVGSKTAWGNGAITLEILPSV